MISNRIDWPEPLYVLDGIDPGICRLASWSWKLALYPKTGIKLTSSTSASAGSLAQTTRGHY